MTHGNQFYRCGINYFLLEVVGFENVKISTLSSGGENSVGAGVLEVLMT